MPSRICSQLGDVRCAFLEIVGDRLPDRLGALAPLVELGLEVALNISNLRRVRRWGRCSPRTRHLHGADIASGATWADRYRDSDRGGSRQRYEQTRQWHFVNIELDGPNLERACFGHPRLPAAVPASSGPAKACLVDKIEQFTAELSNSATAPGERLLALEFLLHLVGDVHQPLHAVDDHDAGGNRKQGGRDRIRRRQPPSRWEKRPTNRVEIRRNPGVVPRLAVPKAVPRDSGVGQLFSTEDSNRAAMTDEPTAEPLPPSPGRAGSFSANVSGSPRRCGAQPRDCAAADRV